MAARKMVAELPYDPHIYNYLKAASGDEGKCELVGSEMVEGVACTKYKITTAEKKIYFMWDDAAKQIPVKTASENGSFTELWTNFKTGAQDVSLFEPPADFKRVTMPPMPSGAGR